MILFDGKYTWDGKKDGKDKPVSWWPGSYRLKIIDLSEENPGVYRLKPIIVLAAETKEGFSVEPRYQDLIKNVCKKFNINLDKVLWISYSSESYEEIKAAVIEPASRIGSELFYTIQWRPLMDNELKEVKRFLPD